MRFGTSAGNGYLFKGIGPGRVWLPTPVGSPSGPFFPWIALACDADSGYVFFPGMSGVDETRTEALLKCALRTLQQAPFRPQAFHVIDAEARMALEPLSLALGVPLQVAAIPAVRQAYEAMSKQLG